MMMKNKVKKAADLLGFLTNSARDIEIFGMFGAGNIGDEAMLVAAQKSFLGGRCIPWKSYNKYPFLDALIRRRPRKHLLVGGGTLIHGGNTGWLDYVEMRSNQGVNVSFFGTGLAFSSEQIAAKSESFRRWSAILEKSKEIHLRGPHSVDLCHFMCGRGEVFGDFAFLLHSDDILVRDHSTRDNTIGINIGKCLGDQRLFEHAAVDLAKRLSHDHRLVFHIVVASDVEATQRVISSANLPENSYEVQEHYFDPIAFMCSIRRHRAFLGLKLHAAGLAMVSGVPALMIAYLPKCRDFMTPLGATDHMVIDLPLDANDAFSRIISMLAKPENYIIEDKIREIALQQRSTLQRVYED